MKQSEIVVGIVITLALAVGIVYAAGGFETGGLNTSTEMNSVIVKDAIVSRTIDNTTNGAENKTIRTASEPGPGIVNTIIGIFSNVVETSSSGGSARSSSSSEGSSSSSSSSGGAPVTPMATETPCPTTEPTTTSTVKVTATPTTNETATPTPTTSPTATPTPTPTATTTPVPAATTEPALDSTPTVSPTIDPTPTPTPTTEVTIETWTGTAGVARTYYYIVDHATETTSVIVESEFPPELAGMMSMELHDYVYYFSNVELKNIYLHFYNRNAGPNGENYGGPTIETRFGYYDWLMEWDYPLTESVILIYSEDVPVYVISTVDFSQYSFMRNSYTGEYDYIPRKYYAKKAVMPEKQPGIPRYYDLPVSAPIRLFREGMPDNPYLPATPAPTEETTPTPAPEATMTPLPLYTAPTPTEPASNVIPTPISWGEDPERVAITTPPPEPWGGVVTVEPTEIPAGIPTLERYTPSGENSVIPTLEPVEMEDPASIPQE